MKRTLYVLMAALIPLIAHADFEWFNTSTNRITASDGITPLPGNRTNSSMGVFIQLIYAGADDTIDPAHIWGDGTTGDDEVVETAWMGQFIFDPDRDGWMNPFGVVDDDDTSRYYYVRVWSEPSPNYALGYVPMITVDAYGDSFLWQNPGTVPPGIPDEFNFGGTAGFSTNLQAIPEPRALALVLLGLFTVRLIRRRTLQTIPADIY